MQKMGFFFGLSLFLAFGLEAASMRDAVRRARSSVRFALMLYRNKKRVEVMRPELLCLMRQQRYTLLNKQSQLEEAMHEVDIKAHRPEGVPGAEYLPVRDRLRQFHGHIREHRSIEKLIEKAFMLKDKEAREVIRELLEL